MATVNIALHKVSNRTVVGGGILPAQNAIPMDAENVTSSATAALSGLTAGGDDEFWVILPRDGDVYVKFGDADTVAAAGDDWLCMTGVPRWFAAAADQRCSVIDA